MARCGSNKEPKQSGEIASPRKRVKYFVHFRAPVICRVENVIHAARRRIDRSLRAHSADDVRTAVFHSTEYRVLYNLVPNLIIWISEGRPVPRIYRYFVSSVDVTVSAQTSHAQIYLILCKIFNYMDSSLTKKQNIFSILRICLAAVQMFD